MPTTTRRATRQSYPAVTPAVELVRAPVAPCVLIPAGLPGVVAIGSKAYSLAYLTDGTAITGYTLAQADGTAYDLPADLGACECLDSLTRQRPGGCRHAHALRCVKATGRVA